MTRTLRLMTKQAWLDLAIYWELQARQAYVEGSVSWAEWCESEAHVCRSKYAETEE